MLLFWGFCSFFLARIRGTQPDNDDDDDDDEHFAFAGNISRKHGDLHFPRQTRENDQQIDPQAKARHSLRLISSHTHIRVIGYPIWRVFPSVQVGVAYPWPLSSSEDLLYCRSELWS